MATTSAGDALKAVLNREMIIALALVGTLGLLITPLNLAILDFLLACSIALSLIVKAMFIILALSGTATLWMAVFADMGMSLLVTLNGLRMLGYKR